MATQKSSKVLDIRFILSVLIAPIYGNGPVERAHRTILQEIKALLVGVGLDVCFWSYVYMHVLHIRNALPGQNQNTSPLFLVTGKKDNFQNL